MYQTLNPTKKLNETEKRKVIFNKALSSEDIQMLGEHKYTIFKSLFPCT